MGQAGNINLNSDRIMADRGSITATSVIVEANQWKINENNKIELMANNVSQQKGDFAVPFLECYPE